MCAATEKTYCLDKSVINTRTITALDVQASRAVIFITLI